LDGCAVTVRVAIGNKLSTCSLLFGFNNFFREVYYSQKF
jgi:hypothetical protein